MGLIGMTSEQTGTASGRPGGGDRRIADSRACALAATGIYLLRGLPSSFSELRASAP